MSRVQVWRALGCVLAAMATVGAAPAPPLPPVGELVRAVSSPRPADRERAVFQLGDLEVPDAASVSAVVGALGDPVAAVRWNALSTLHKMGRAATAPLLASLGDARSAHVWPVATVCEQSELVPARGELAAVALHLLEEIDVEAAWARYIAAAGDEKLRAKWVLRSAKKIPSEAVLRTVTALKPDDRRLLLELASRGDAATARVLADAVEGGHASSLAEAVRPIEREVLEMVGGMGEQGREAWRRLANKSVWPEDVFATVPLGGDTVQIAADSFRMAVASGRPTALASLGQKLDQWVELRGGAAEDWPSALSSWMQAVGSDAAIRFLEQPLPEGVEERRALWRSAKLFARDPSTRPHLLALAQRLLSTLDPETCRWSSELFGELAFSSGDPWEIDRLWRLALAALAASPPQRTGVIESADRAVLKDFPFPSAHARPEIARQLVARVLEGRLSSVALDFPSRERYSDLWQQLLARAMRDELLSAARRAKGRFPGAEARYAALLSALDAPLDERIRALRAVDASTTTLPGEVIWALHELAGWRRERLFALSHLGSRLRAEKDEQVARKIAGVMVNWETADSPDENQGERAASGREAAWAIAADRTAPALARRVAIKAVLDDLSVDDAAGAALWVERGTSLLDDLDPSAVGPILRFLVQLAYEMAGLRFDCGDERHRTVASPDALLKDPLPGALLQRLQGALSRLARRDAGHQGLIIRAWRGFGLPADAEIDRIALALEAGGHQRCSIPGTWATLADLERARALPERSPGRPEELARTISSRSSQVACAAIEALPAFGWDAVPVARDLLLRFALSGEWNALPEGGFRGRDCAADVGSGQMLARALERMNPSVVRESVRQALNAQPPPPSHSDEVAGAPERSPDPDGLQDVTERVFVAPEDLRPLERAGTKELEIFRLEKQAERSRFESEDRELVAIVAALPEDTGDLFTDHLARVRSPGAPWSAFARAWWLVPKEGVLSERRRAALERSLTLLAARWPALEPEERARLLWLLDVAPAGDRAVETMLRFSLTQPAAGERARAVVVAGRHPVDPDLLASASFAESRTRAIRERFSGDFEKFFLFQDDASAARQRSLCVEQLDLLSALYEVHPQWRSLYSELPSFPWPPPAGYRTPEPLDPAWFGGPAQTIGDVFGRLETAFQQISPDYEVSLFSGPPGGFAVVARLERIDAEGNPFPGRVRWTREGRAKFDLAELLGDLFLEKPGYFRVVVFAVTDEATFTPQVAAIVPDVTAGARVMPYELKQQKLGDKHIFALVYSFERSPGHPMRAWVDGCPSARRHLQAAGIWERIAGQ